MPHITIKDTVYHYRIEGTGKPLLFAHGLFVDHSIFNHQFKAFKSNYTCYSLDLPGHGKTNYKEEGWTLDDISEDIKTFIMQLQLKNVSLVGLSQGGMVFMRLAARYPELVNTLTLIGTTPLPEYEERLPEWKETIEILKNENRKEIKNRMKSIQEHILGEKFIKEQPRKRQKELQVMTNNNPKAMILATKAAVLQRSDFRRELSNIQCPTLIMTGEKDHATPREAAEEMNRLIPISSIEIIPYAGHHIPVEQPAICTQKIQSFLGSFSKSTRN